MFSVVTDFDKLRVERFKRATEDKLRDIRCPEHHQPPRLRFHGTSLRDITISLSGCCYRVMEIANARIGSPWVSDAGSVKAS
jgi:5'-3' exonuclease